jgi:carbonic anhydrase
MNTEKLTSSSSFTSPSVAEKTTAVFPGVAPDTALARLKEGNRRFVQNLRSVETLTRQKPLREQAKEGQKPFAIVLSCSDSRAPSEILFDQGLGDLFVIRVAGNVVAPSLVGSVEFAAATFGSRLVVVMGHSGCGAIAATLDSLRSKDPAPSENIHDILSRIRPHVAHLKDLDHSREECMAKAIRSNVAASVNHLKHGSQILERMCAEGRIEIVGAEYSLETGEVEFFDA